MRCVWHPEAMRKRLGEEAALLAQKPGDLNSQAVHVMSDIAAVLPQPVAV